MSTSALARATTSTTPKALVIWAHGLGDSGRSWTFFRREIPHYDWRCPTAPTRSVSVAYGDRMPAWFDMDDLPVLENSRDDKEGLMESVKSIHGMIDQALETGITPEMVVLGGFSQGGALALAAGLRYPKRLAGIVSVAGWLLLRDELPAAIAPANAHTPILMIHGTADDKVPFAMGRLAQKTCLDAGLPVEFKEHDLPHTLDDRAVDWIKHFLDTNLQTAQANPAS